MSRRVVPSSMDGSWTRRSTRTPREILDRVKALEVDAPEGTVDERERRFRLSWHRPFVYPRPPLLVGRVREEGGGSAVELRIERDGPAFQEVLGGFGVAVWWLAVLGAMLPDPGIAAGTKGLALGAGGLVTAFLVGFRAAVSRWARQDRERLRKLADDLIGPPP